MDHIEQRQKSSKEEKEQKTKKERTAWKTGFMLLVVAIAMRLCFLAIEKQSFVTPSKRFQTIKEGITQSDASLLSCSHCNMDFTVSAIHIRCFPILLIIFCYVWRDSEFLS